MHKKERLSVGKRQHFLVGGALLGNVAAGPKMLSSRTVVEGRTTLPISAPVPYASGKFRHVFDHRVNFCNDLGVLLALI